MLTASRRNVLRLFDDVVNEARYHLLSEIMTADFVDHAPGPGQVAGPAGTEQMLREFRAAVPDLRARVVACVEEGDLIATREEWSGRVVRQYRGVEASHVERHGTRMHLFRMRDGKIAEEWSEGAGIFAFAPPAQ